MKRKRPNDVAFVPRDTTLPILQKKDDILQSLAANDVLVLVSETGSGKTTQVPQIILDGDPSASVIITQPRRVAAVTVAMRVAAERRVRLGDEVGYAVRFDDMSQRGTTRIRYVTDGVFLREALVDSSRGLKNRYSHVIIDEVHERSVNTDIALGIIKETLTASHPPSRSDVPAANIPSLVKLLRSQLAFKVIIMSATTDTAKIMSFLKQDSSLNVQSMMIPGRAHEVKLLVAINPVSDYVDGAASSVLDINAGHPPPGDILVFLPGQDDIAACMACVKQRAKATLSKEERKHLSLVSLYASQSPLDQLKAIQPLPEELRHTDRKIIFSTNIAETSITIPGVKYVVDSGVVKVRSVINHKGVYTDVLKVEPVSQAQADQRMGRAGRTEPGLVFRLYTQDDYDELEKYPVPEIVRTDAADTLLKIIALRQMGSHSRGKKNATDDSKGASLIKFPLIDDIPKAARTRGLEVLIHLGAIDTSMKLTRAGELMSRIPTSPYIARSLLESLRIGCLDSMLSVAAVLSVEGEIFLRPSTKHEEAKAAHRRFFNAGGDHLSLVQALSSFILHGSANKKVAFCRDHFLNHRTLSSAESIRAQLHDVLQHGDMISWAFRNPFPLEVAAAIEESSVDDMVRRALSAGFFRNAAYKRSEDGKYVPLGCVSSEQGTEIAADIHPSSVLRSFKSSRSPMLVLYNEMVWTSKLYLRSVVAVEKDWLLVHSNKYIKERKDFS